MSDFESNENNELPSEEPLQVDDGVDTAWSLITLRAKASPVLSSNLGLRLMAVPADGECLVHALTRSLGLLPRRQWNGTRLLDWAHLFRLHLARHISGEEEQAFLYGHDYLDDRFAILFARLWRLRISAHPYQEWPRRQLQFLAPQFFPLAEDDDLLDVRLALQTQKEHFDILFPRNRNFYSHTCLISAHDLNVLFAGSDGEILFDRFMFKWLSVLRSRNPSVDNGLYRFSSVAEFMDTFKVDTWPAPHYLSGLLELDGSVFVNNEQFLESLLQDAVEGVEDGISLHSTVDSMGNAAPTHDVDINDRYGIWVCIFSFDFILLHVLRWYTIRIVQHA